MFKKIILQRQIANLGVHPVYVHLDLVLAPFLAKYIGGAFSSRVFQSGISSGWVEKCSASSAGVSSPFWAWLRTLLRNSSVDVAPSIPLVPAIILIKGLREQASLLSEFPSFAY
jgi:hypothetical protein